MFAADVLWIAAGLIVILLLTALSGLKLIGWIFLLANLVFIAAYLLCSNLVLGLVKAGFYDAYRKEPEEAKLCPSCGAQVKPEDAFCSSCGAKIE